MSKLVVWAPEQIKNELSKRFQTAKNGRVEFEAQWAKNERSLMNQQNQPISLESLYGSFTQGAMDTPDSSVDRIGVNKNLKNFRLIHSQLSANPPSVIPRPASNDKDDRQKADAADRCVRYGIRKYSMMEKFDQLGFQTLLYGTGFNKCLWDPEAGDLVDIDESGNMVMEGDFSITVPSTWDVYPDPDQGSWQDVRYVFEGAWLTLEEAIFQFPEHEERLRAEAKSLADAASSPVSAAPSYGNPIMLQRRRDVVYVLQYWEKGMPLNGFVGRFCHCLPDGTQLTPLTENPHQFSRPKTYADKLREAEGEEVKRPMQAFLPYNVFTDIDYPNTYWGISVLSYSAELQEVMNNLDSVTLETIQAHGVPRLILPEGAEVADDSVTNSPWDVVKITGTQPPFFMENAQMPRDVPQFRQVLNQGIDDLWGVNESMFGQQSREQSGFSMQYATNQGNMIRRRFFNKYVNIVEATYKIYLNVIREHWSTPRVIQVLGKEKAFESIELSGADIDGGFDLVVEYGASLSLDPVSRKEEILTLAPMFKEAGISMMTILKMLKLNELDSLHDRTTQADDRQREIFEKIIASGKQVQPRPLQDHDLMLAYAYDYVMSAEFQYLSEENKQLIEQHIELREKVAAERKAKAAEGQQAFMPGAMGAPAGAAPLGAAGPGLPPMMPGVGPLK